MLKSDIINALKNVPDDQEVIISVDISSLEDPFLRAFGDEYSGYMYCNGEIVLLMTGYLNEDKENK